MDKIALKYSVVFVLNFNLGMDFKVYIVVIVDPTFVSLEILRIELLGDLTASSDYEHKVAYGTNKKIYQQLLGNAGLKNFNQSSYWEMLDMTTINDYRMLKDSFESNTRAFPK